MTLYPESFPNNPDHALPSENVGRIRHVPEVSDDNDLATIVAALVALLAIQVANAPEKFPYKNAIKNTWTVFYFEDVGQSRTRLTLVGLGYGNDDESRKLRNFFDKGNSDTVKKLQEKFADKKQTPMKGE